MNIRIANLSHGMIITVAALEMYMFRDYEIISHVPIELRPYNLKDALYIG